MGPCNWLYTSRPPKDTKAHLKTLSWHLSSDGELSAVVDTATIDSTLVGVRDVITAPLGLELRKGKGQSFTFNSPLNLYQAAGRTFTNQFTVEGSAVQNDIPCTDTALLDFTIGS